MVRIILAIIAIVFSSCVGQKGVLKYMHDNPKFASKYCADAFPIKEKIVKEVEYIKADNIDYTKIIDSVNNVNQSQIDSLKAISNRDTTDNCLEYKKLIKTLKNPIEKVKEIYIPCKSDTVKVKEVIVQENTAEIKRLTIEKEEHKMLNIALSVLLLIMVLLLCFKK